jgi:hypothetical protein
MEAGCCSEQSKQTYVSLLGVTNQIVISVLLNYSVTVARHSDSVILKSPISSNQTRLQQRIFRIQQAILDGNHKNHSSEAQASSYTILQSVPLATEPGISLIILPLMRILQRNLKRTYLIV